VAAYAAAISVVLGDCDLLDKIFLHPGFATNIVCAAAVCRHWLRAASDLRAPAGVAESRQADLQGRRREPQRVEEERAAMASPSRLRQRR
jgi:hypothetical protein